jgi:hypothetical protein
LLTEQREEPVALLCGDSKVTAVYASTFGREAERLFHDCYVYVECGELVENMLGYLKDLDVFVRKNGGWNSGFEECLRKGLGFVVVS